MCFYYSLRSDAWQKNCHAFLSNSLLKNKLTEESPTCVTSGGACPHASPFPRYRGRNAPRQSGVHRDGGKARRAITRITKTNTSLERGEGVDGPCAHGMPANGTRNASSSSSRNPNSEQITDRLQGGKTYVGHLQTRISPAHPLLLPLQVPYRPLPAENNTITTVEVLSISNHLKPTLLQPERSARAQTTLPV